MNTKLTTHCPRCDYAEIEIGGEPAKALQVGIWIGIVISAAVSLGTNLLWAVLR